MIFIIGYKKFKYLKSSSFNTCPISAELPLIQKVLSVGISNFFGCIVTPYWFF